MSMWTHVNGNIRLDEFGEHSVDKIKSIMGKMYVYRPELSGLSESDFSSDTNEITLPFGSEGSLLYSVVANKDVSSLPAYSISIWGDLRDYDTDTVRGEIIPWFKNLLLTFKSAYMIMRNAMIEIEVEDGTHIALIGVLKYNEDTREYIPEVFTLNIEINKE